MSDQQAKEAVEIAQWANGAKRVNGFPDYAVTACGKVISTKRGKVRILKACKDSKGYPGVLLYAPGAKRKNAKVHRLVATAFLENPMDKPQVNHIDGDPSNNAVDNLEWATPVENVRHSIATGLRLDKGELSACAKLSSADVLEIRELKKVGVSHREMAALFGVTHGNINAIVGKRTWKHI